MGAVCQMEYHYSRDDIDSTDSLSSDELQDAADGTDASRVRRAGPLVLGRRLAPVSLDADLELLRPGDPSDQDLVTTADDLEDAFGP